MVPSTKVPDPTWPHCAFTVGKARALIVQGRQDFPVIAMRKLAFWTAAACASGERKISVGIDIHQKNSS
jgi:hypothetical protein